MRHVAFVRNIMIGREGLLRTVLLGFFEEHGATDPVSYISTGNVGFSVAPDCLDRVVAGVEGSIASVIGRHESLFIRSLDRLSELTARDPYDWPEFDIQDRLVTFTQQPASLELALPHVADRGDYAVLEMSGSEIYSVTLDVVGRIRSPGGFIEKQVGEKITTRGWNTVLRVVDKESAGT